MELLTPSFGLILWTIGSTLALLALVDVLLLRFSSGKEKLAWILLIVFIPFVGSIVYFGIGRKRRINTKSY